MSHSTHTRGQQRKRISVIAALFIGIVTVALVVVLFVVRQYAQATPQTSPFGAAPATYATPSIQPASQSRGKIGATLITTSHLAITLLAVQKEPTRWLFHFKVVNLGVTSTQVLEANTPITGAMHANQAQLARQFVIPVVNAAGRTQEERPLSAPLVGELASHPTLSATLLAKGTSDGWLAVDITNIGPTTPTELLYDYDPSPGMKCANPAVPTTCTPETLYTVVIWDLA